MTERIYTHQQLAALQRKANEPFEVLNAAKARLTKEVVEALTKAHDEGKDLDGVSFELVFITRKAAVVDRDDDSDGEDKVASKKHNAKGRK